jgi:hypothetical protein
MSLEQEIEDLLTRTLAGNPQMLKWLTGELPPDAHADAADLIQINYQMVGALRHAVVRLAREIDDLRASESGDLDS